MHIDTINIQYHPLHLTGCIQRLAQSKSKEPTIERLYLSGVNYDILRIDLLCTFPIAHVIDDRIKPELFYPHLLQLLTVNGEIDYSSFHSLN